MTGAAAARAVSGHAVVANLATHVPGTGPRAFLPGAWKEMDRVRREGSAIVANAAIAAGVERLIQESFALTYPDSGARWVDESAPPRPAPYNRTVLDAEASAGRVTEAGRIGVALRFALLYGGVEDGFTRDILQYARRGWLPLLGRPDGYVSMVTHDDAARAVVAALDAPPGIYNVVDDEPLTRYELTRILGDVLSVPRRSCRRRGSRRSAARSARRSRSRCASRIARCAPPRAGGPATRADVRGGGPRPRQSPLQLSGARGTRGRRDCGHGAPAYRQGLRAPVFTLPDAVKATPHGDAT